MVASQLTVRSSFSALQVLCLWFALMNGAGAARMLRLLHPPSLEIAEVIHRKLQTGSYCVAISNADSKKLQTALDWACGSGSGLGNVDCSAILQGGPCYQPNSVVSHASYAFDAYYVKQNGATGSCNFQGLAMVTQTNPGSGSCVYPSTASSSTPTTTTTPTPSSSTPSSSTPTLSPPVVSNSTTPTFGSPTTATGTTSGAIGGARVPGIHTVVLVAVVACFICRLY